MGFREMGKFQDALAGRPSKTRLAAQLEAVAAQARQDFYAKPTPERTLANYGSPYDDISGGAYAQAAGPTIRGIAREYLGPDIGDKVANFADLTPAPAFDTLSRQHYNQGTSPLEWGSMALDMMPGIGKAGALGAKAIFAGIAAKTADKAMLSKAEKLLEMSPGARTMKSPLETQDYPNDQQIVRFGGGDAASVLPMDEASRMARVTSRPGKTRKDIEIQGGPLTTKPNNSGIIRILEDHSWQQQNPMELAPSERNGQFFYDNNDGQIVAEEWSKGDRLERKTFDSQTSLRTIRNWLGY